VFFGSSVVTRAGDLAGFGGVVSVIGFEGAGEELS